MVQSSHSPESELPFHRVWAARGGDTKLESAASIMQVKQFKRSVVVIFHTAMT